MNKKIKPLKGVNLKENRVLIKKHEKLTKSEGGIILPDDQSVQPEGGIVVAIGPTVNPDLAKIGENVRYYLHGLEAEIGGEKYYLCRDSDVWAGIE